VADRPGEAREALEVAEEDLARQEMMEQDHRGRRDQPARREVEPRRQWAIQHLWAAIPAGQLEGRRRGRQEGLERM